MRTYTHQYNSTLKCDNIVYFPMSIRANKFPLSAKNITFNDVKQQTETEKHNGEITFIEINDIENNGKKIAREEVTFKINESQDELMAFGIWGRIYTRDVDHNKKVTEKDIIDFNNVMEEIYRTNDKKKVE